MNKFKKVGIMLIFYFMFSVSITVSARSNLYSLVVNGYNEGENDRSLIYNRLYFNRLDTLDSQKHLNVYKYDQENEGGGTTKTKLNIVIDKSMQGATKNDYFLFYYSGHSASLKGISLAGYREGDKIYYTEEYLYKDLASKLEQFPGKVIVILDCCHAENFYIEGIKNFGNRKKKFSCLLACGSEQESEPKKYIVLQVPQISIEKNIW